MSIIIKIATDFSIHPGARYYKDGTFSGQEFYDKLLKSKYVEAKESNKKLIINLDDTEGYATSFLDEAFGRLSKKFGNDEVWNNIEIISIDEPDWIEEIKEYIYEERPDIPDL
jgi:hypothetical protein